MAYVEVNRVQRAPNRLAFTVAAPLALVLIFAASFVVLAGRGRAPSAPASLGGGAPRVSTAATPSPTSTPSPSPTPTPHTYSTMLSIGDSLAGGYYASTWSHSYAAIVAAQLPSRLLTTPVYYGHSAVNALEAMSQYPPPAADLALLELGTNDQEDLGTFQRDYAAVLGYLQRANPRIRLVCLGPWQPSTDAAYNTVVQQQCAKAGGTFIDLFPLFDVESYHGPNGRATWLGPGDWFHPNDAGMAAIARAILRVLRG
jgi:acyl-CoA thioesterase I